MAPIPPNTFAIALESFIADIKREEDIRSPFYKEVLVHIINGPSKPSLDQRQRSEQELAEYIQALGRKQKRNSKTLAISEKLRPLVAGLSQYTAACDVMAQAAPAAAMLIYGGARMVLQLAEKFNNCFESVISMMEDVGHLLDCYQKFSRAYESSVDMQRLLVQTYKNIVSFWLKASKLFSKKAYKTLLSGIVKPLDAEWQRCRQALQEDRERVKMLAQATDAEMQKQKEEKDVARQQAKLRNQIVEWIKASQGEDRLDVRRDIRENFERRHENTCDWLFEHPQVEQWLAAKKSTSIWYSAGPGAGKTILSSVLAKKLQDDGRRVAAFFCSFNCLVRRKAITVLRSLALQLLGPKDPIPEKVKRLYEDDLTNHCSKLMDLRTMTEVVEALLKQQPRVHIIVDGMDECDDKGYLITSLCHLLQSKTMGIVKWFFTSRPDPDLRTIMRKQGVMEIEPPQESLMADIRTYLTGRLEDDCCVDHWTTLSDGNFLWMTHILPVLEGNTSTCAEDIEDELEKFPKGLTGCYARSLTQLSKRPQLHQQLARMIFIMVVGAVQPMRFSELIHALAASKGMPDYSPQRLPKRELVEELSSNLIVFDCSSRGTDEDPLVKVAHKSVQDFFLQDPDELDLPDDNVRQYFVSTPIANLELGQAALSYLSYIRYNAPQDVLAIIENGEHAFLRHAAIFWHRYLSAGAHDEELSKKVIAFMQGDAFWNCVAVQSHVAPHLFARYTQMFGGYKLEATGLQDNTNADKVTYAIPLPEWLEEYTPLGPRLVEAFYRFVTEWHPVLNSHSTAIDQCIMDFEWQMSLPGRIPWQSNSVKFLAFRGDVSSPQLFPVSISDIRIDTNGVMIQVVEINLSNKQSGSKWVSLDTTQVHFPKGSQRRPVFSTVSVQSKLFKAANGLDDGYWHIDTSRLSAQYYNSSEAEGIDPTPAPGRFHAPERAIGQWICVCDVNNNVSPTAAAVAFHCSRDPSTKSASRETVSRQESGYGSMSGSDSESDSDIDSDSGISTSAGSASPTQHCMFIVRDNEPPLWHFWKVSPRLNIEAPCAFHPTEPIAVWSPSPHELCIMDLATGKVQKTILPEPTDAQFSTICASRKEFHFSKCESEDSNTLHYMLYTATRTETGLRHAVSVSTFIFSNSRIDGAECTLERTQATQSVSYESASPLQHPLILTSWSPESLYVAFPSLSCNPKMLQIQLNHDDDSDSDSDEDQVTAEQIQTLTSPIYFPYSTPYRNPRLRLLKRKPTSKKETLALLLDAELATATTTSTSTSTSHSTQDTIHKPPAVMTWDLKATKDWRAWDKGLGFEVLRIEMRWV